MNLQQAIKRPDPKPQACESLDFDLCGLSKLEHHSHQFEGPLPNELFFRLTQVGQQLSSSFGVPILGARKCKEVLKLFTKKTKTLHVERATNLDPRSHISWVTDRDNHRWSLGYRLHGLRLLVIQFGVFEAILMLTAVRLMSQARYRMRKLRNHTISGWFRPKTSGYNGICYVREESYIHLPTIHTSCWVIMPELKFSNPPRSG